MVEGEVIRKHPAMSVATSNYARSPVILGQILGDMFFPAYWYYLVQIPSLTFDRPDRRWILGL